MLLMAGFFNDTFALNILTVCLKSSNLSLFCVGFFVLLFVCFFGGGGLDQIFSLTQEWEIEGLS